MHIRGKSCEPEPGESVSRFCWMRLFSPACKSKFSQSWPQMQVSEEGSMIIDSGPAEEILVKKYDSLRDIICE